MKAHYTIQCVHPETERIGCWMFTGDSHRIAGTSMSPVFDDVGALFQWAYALGWRDAGFYTMIKSESEVSK